MFKKYFTSFKRNVFNTGNNNNNPQSNNTYAEAPKKEKKKRNFDKELWKKHMYRESKAKALDRRYDDLLTKICAKHNIPAEIQLEIHSYIKDMVHSAWRSRKDFRSVCKKSVAYKVGDAVWIRNRKLLSREEYLAWKRMPYTADTCDFAAIENELYRWLYT